MSSPRDREQAADQEEQSRVSEQSKDSRSSPGTRKPSAEEGIAAESGWWPEDPAGTPVVPESEAPLPPPQEAFPEAPPEPVSAESGIPDPQEPESSSLPPSEPEGELPPAEPPPPLPEAPAAAPGLPLSDETAAAEPDPQVPVPEAETAGPPGAPQAEAAGTVPEAEPETASGIPENTPPAPERKPVGEAQPPPPLPEGLRSAGDQDSPGPAAAREEKPPLARFPVSAKGPGEPAPPAGERPLFSYPMPSRRPQPPVVLEPGGADAWTPSDVRDSAGEEEKTPKAAQGAEPIGGEPAPPARPPRAPAPEARPEETVPGTSAPLPDSGQQEEAPAARSWESLRVRAEPAPSGEGVGPGEVQAQEGPAGEGIPLKEEPAASLVDQLTREEWAGFGSEGSLEPAEPRAAEEPLRDADFPGETAHLYRDATRFVLDAIRGAQQGRGPDLKRGEALIQAMLRSMESDSSLLLLATDRRQKFSVSTHSVNVAILCLRIAGTLKYRPPKRTRVGLAALVHEIGVGALPREIMHSQSQMSPELRKRSVYSARIIGEMCSGYEGLAEIVEQVYEREDGSGYPRGLKKDEIREEAKILGMADVFEACLHDRPYRKALTGYQMIHELTRGKARTFSASIVRAMVKSFSLYPYNEYVILNTKELAQVVEINARNSMRPRVKILYDNRGDPVDPIRELDLAQHPSLYISKAVTYYSLPEKLE